MIIDNNSNATPSPAPVVEVEETTEGSEDKDIAAIMANKGKIIKKKGNH